MVDYSQYYKTPDESLYDYLVRMQSDREGGILGTKGLMDVKKIDPEEEADLGEVAMSCPVGQVWNGVACVPEPSTEGDDQEIKSQHDRYLESDEYKQGFSFEDYKMQNALDRLTGRQYAAQGLLYGIPNMIVNWSDRMEVKNQLLANGYTEEQADAMVNDPEMASATNMLGRLGTMPTHEYDYKQQNTQDSLFDVGKSIVGSIFGLNEDKEENYSRQSPFMTPEQYNQQGYKGLPALEAAKTAQIVEAQGRKLFDPYNQFNLDALTKQAQEMAAQEAAQLQAEKARQQQLAAAQAATTAAEQDAIARPSGSSGGSWSTSDSGTSVYSPSSWSADDTSSWDTSGGGTNADGSYDISSWF